MQQGEAIGRNKGNPMLAVEHAKLERMVINGEPHPIRSKCPVCEDGMLPVKFAKSNELPMVADQCVKCGQRFGYEDERIGERRVWAPMGCAFKFRSKERGGRDELPLHSADKPYIAPARILNPEYFDPEARKNRIIMANPPAPEIPYYLDDNSWSLAVWTKPEMFADETDMYLVEPLSDEAPFDVGVRFEMFEGADKIVAEGKVVSLPPQPAMTLAEFLKQQGNEEEQEGQGGASRDA